MWNMARISFIALEKISCENVDDDGQTDNRCLPILYAHLLAFGSDELIITWIIGKFTCLTQRKSFCFRLICLPQCYLRGAGCNTTAFLDIPWIMFLRPFLTHYHKGPVNKKWAASWQTNKMTLAPSKDLDQPGSLPRLIRVFTVRSLGS